MILNELDLLEEHAAVKAKREAAEKEARELAYQKREEARIEQELIDKKPIYDALIAALEKYGYKVTRDRFHVVADDIPISSQIGIERQWVSRGFRNGSYTGNFEVVIGDYGNRKRFKPRGDGTLNYAKMAERLHHYIIEQKARAELRKNQLANAEARNQVIQAVDLGVWTSTVQATADTSGAKPVLVTLKTSHSMTALEAIEVLAYLKGKGFYIA